MLTTRRRGCNEANGCLGRYAGYLRNDKGSHSNLRRAWTTTYNAALVHTTPDFGESMLRGFLRIVSGDGLAANCDVG